MRIDATALARRVLTPELRDRIHATGPSSGRCHLMVNRGLVQATIYDADSRMLGYGVHTDPAVAFDLATSRVEIVGFLS